MAGGVEELPVEHGFAAQYHRTQIIGPEMGGESAFFRNFKFYRVAQRGFTHDQRPSGTLNKAALAVRSVGETVFAFVEILAVERFFPRFAGVDIQFGIFYDHHL